MDVELIASLGWWVSMKINRKCNPMSSARNSDPFTMLDHKFDLLFKTSSKRLKAKGRFTPWTMEDGIFPWSDLMVQLPWFGFLKNQITKPLGFSRGVN